MYIGGTIAFLSLQGYVLFFKNSSYRNVGCVYISLQPSFSAQAGILDGPGAFRQFKLCISFLHSADVMNRNENLLLFRILHVEVGGLCLIFEFFS